MVEVTNWRDMEKASIKLRKGFATIIVSGLRDRNVCQQLVEDAHNLGETNVSN